MDRSDGDITPLVITFNEEENIARTLAALSWARRIVAVDSGSTDETRSILEACPQVSLFSRRFDSFAQQCSFGASETDIDTDWILSLDADHVLTPESAAELEKLDPPPEVDGYLARFTYCIHGKPLRGSLYPPRVVLFRRGHGRFVDDGHGHRIVTEGGVGRLKAGILHDDRKPLSRWLSNQSSYMLREARKISDTSFGDLSMSDRLRKLVVPAPFLVLLYCLFLKRGILDGRAGWHYALERMIAESILSLRLIENKLRPATKDESGGTAS